MRLYPGSVIVNRLPLWRQTGEIFLRHAEAYRLIDHYARDVKVTRARILRQILAYHEAEIEWHLSGFINFQLRFDHRGELLADFIKLFKFQIRRQFTGHFFIPQRHLFIAHIVQPVGAGVGQCPRRVEVGLY